MTVDPTLVPLMERLARATLGRYDIIAALGEGGMATVFLARDLTLDRQVAIKVMHPTLMTSPAALGRFRREARVAAALDHPHIISIFTVGDDPELAYYVMRYLEGRTLHQVIGALGALPLPRVVAILDAVGQALQYAHRRGVVHRDVKPANIMVLDQDDWIVVTDFGIAKLDEGEHLTMSGHVVGTPSYMCPEYFNHGRISAASDQYALGVVAYEMLTGTVPFGGHTVGELMRGHILDAVPSVCSIRPDLPAAVDAVIRRMLAKEPGARFSTIGDAVTALKAAAGGTTSSEVATEIIRTPVSGGMRRGAGWRSLDGIRRHRVRLMSAGALVAIVGALVTLVLLDGVVPAATPASGPGTVAAPPATTTEGPIQAAPGASGAGEPSPAATTSPPSPLPSPPSPTTGEIRIGSRLPLAVLYVNDGPPRLLGEQGIQTFDVAAGRTRLSIRLDDCVPWDTTVDVRAGSTHTIGYRAPRC